MMKHKLFRLGYILTFAFLFLTTGQGNAVLNAEKLGATHLFADIIAFGDSLTDVGNVALLTKAGFSPRIKGYYQETHFSDNIIWVEILSEFLSLPPRTPGRGKNFTLTPAKKGNTWAWGGSEAAKGTVQPNGVVEPIPNLLKEVNQYLHASKGAREDILYTIWSGADNLLIGGKFGPKAAKKAVNAVINAMYRLEHAGARHILVFNMPRLGDTPRAQSGGKMDEAAANLYADSYNKNLRKALIKLFERRKFKAKIYFADIFTEFVRIVKTVKDGKTYTPTFFVPGAQVAIKNVTSEGLNFFNKHGTYPQHYLFWDDVHPTTQGHQIVAGIVLKELGLK